MGWTWPYSVMVSSIWGVILWLLYAYKTFADNEWILKTVDYKTNEIKRPKITLFKSWLLNWISGWESRFVGRRLPIFEDCQWLNSDGLKGLTEIINLSDWLLEGFNSYWNENMWLWDGCIFGLFALEGTFRHTSGSYGEGWNVWCASVLTTVTSQARHLPPVGCKSGQGMSVTPTGYLPSDLNRPAGSLSDRILPRPRARHIRSIRWWKWHIDLPELHLHNKPCVPQASTRIWVRLTEIDAKMQVHHYMDRLLVESHFKTQAHRYMSSSLVSRRKPTATCHRVSCQDASPLLHVIESRVKTQAHRYMSSSLVPRRKPTATCHRVLCQDASPPLHGQPHRRVLCHKKPLEGHAASPRCDEPL